MDRRYFLFEEAVWTIVFGTNPGTDVTAQICRNGQQGYSGTVVPFVDGVGRLSYPGFEAWDYILPPGVACPLPLPKTTYPVSMTALGPVGVAPANTYFHFDNNDREQSFKVETWGSYSVGDTADPANNDLVYFQARQCRNGVEIWLGLVATGATHFEISSGDTPCGRREPYGRREPEESGVFQSGDEIVPFSESCIGS
ncbi:unnamed protein product [Cylindrotheca closterium]|uniref:Uncharacterized protein n=1 Tax=Cylindrotheca closterium TaxID=2856 RepID=A0AAD2JJV7_9STRA|nr:unnamed protein product [Cylindrotheca closterium]